MGEIDQEAFERMLHRMVTGHVDAVRKEVVVLKERVDVHDNKLAQHGAAGTSCASPWRS